MGDYGDVRAFEPLVATLGDLRLGEQQSFLREDAALTLGDMNDARACEPLTHWLTDWRPGYVLPALLRWGGSVCRRRFRR